MPDRKKRASRPAPAKKGAKISPAAAKRSASAQAASQDTSLREHVLYLLRDGGAHVGWEKVVDDFPADSQGIKPAGLPFSAWQILEHMRIAQWDILEFSRDPKHVSPVWPAGYWPPSDAPPDPAAWDRSVAAFRRDLRAMERLVANPATDLHATIPHGDGQTILREALLTADHNAYHLGQIVILRRLLGAWHD